MAHVSELIATDIDAYLDAQEHKSLLRFITCGSVDDDRFPLQPGETPVTRSIRFRTLGCYPLTGAVESCAAAIPEIIGETMECRFSERCGRVIDHDGTAAMERKKQEGYF